MKELILQRRNSTVTEDRFDLFSGLLEAADDPTDQLTDEELIGTDLLVSVVAASLTHSGNVFIFLIAGHEVRSPSSRSPEQDLPRSTDDCTHAGVYFWPSGSLSERAGETLSAHHVCCRS